MKITVKATNLELTPSLSTYIDEKLGALSKFIQRFDEKGAAELKVEVGRTTKHHHKGDVFMAEANLILPGKMLRAAEIHRDLRVAIDLVRDTLRLEISRHKTRIIGKRTRVR